MYNTKDSLVWCYCSECECINWV